MAVYNLAKREQNSHVSKHSSKALSWSHSFDVTPAADNVVSLGDGDIIHIGKLPAECFVTSMVILTHEGFSVGTFDLGFIGDFPDVSLTPIATTIDLTADNTSTVVTLPTSGVVNGNGIWSGVDGISLAVKCNGVPTTGACTLVIGFSSFEGYANT